jgi:hypothetical protein
VQFGSLILVLLMLSLYRGRYGGTGYLLAALAAHAGAKWLEVADARVFALGQAVSGHTVKHLAAVGRCGRKSTPPDLAALVEAKIPPDRSGRPDRSGGIFSRRC